MIEVADPTTLLSDPDKRGELMEALSAEGLAVSKSFLSYSELQHLMETIRELKETSEPAWQPISFGTPNFQWINDNNPLSSVKGAFRQYNFFPWDKRSEELYGRFGVVLRVRNQLLGAEESAFMNPAEGDPITVRLAAQFYPTSHGWMQEHRDPQGPHQTVLASLVMSSYGSDYSGGGLFVRSEQGEKVFPEESLSPGDLLWFTPTLAHGVEKIEGPGGVGFSDWDDEAGRWMMLCASNGLTQDAHYARAKAVN